jgi:iron uptake system EfeUOB component EfeO/EfeM
VYGRIEMVAPGTSAEMPVEVGAGVFTVSCSPGSGTTSASAQFAITNGPTTPALGVAPVTFRDFVTPINTYELYVGGQLTALARDLRPLRASVAAGDLVAAEADYPNVHAYWERIGAEYDAFEPLSDAINGNAFGLARGENDPAFTGFHKLEAELWEGAPTGATLSTIDTLAADVTKLLTQITVQPADYVVRAHEIIENALQEQATGLVEPHSHTGIADTAASTDGAQMVWQTLQPLVAARDATLSRAIDAGFGRLDGVLAALRRPNDAYPDDNQLSGSSRERLTGSLSALLEDLAHLPGLLAPPPPPSGDQF